MTNSADPDQLAFSEANWSGSTLFAKIGHVVLSKRRVNPQVLRKIFPVRLNATQNWMNKIKCIYKGWTLDFQLAFDDDKIGYFDDS